MSTVSLAESYVSIGAGISFSRDLEDVARTYIKDVAEQLLLSSPKTGYEKGDSLAISYGQTMTNNLAWQVSYIDGGDISGDVSFNNPQSIGQIDADYNIKTIELVGIANFPITDRLSVFAQAGIHSWDAEININGSNDDTSEEANFKAEDDGTDLTYAVGAAADINDQFAIKLQWQVYEVDDTDAENVTARLVYTF